MPKLKLSCYICEKTFTRKHDLSRHVNSVHNICTNWKICPECKMGFAHTRNFQRHIKEAHPHLKDELNSAMKMVQDMKDLAMKPYKHIPPPEARLSKDSVKPKIYRPTSKLSTLKEDLQLSSDSSEDDFEPPKFPLNKKDKKILEEFLILPETATESKTKKKPKLKTGPKKPSTRTTECSTMTDHVALTMREILAYVDTAIWADIKNVQKIQERLEMRLGTYQARHPTLEEIMKPEGYDVQPIVEIEWIEAIEEAE